MVVMEMGYDDDVDEDLRDALTERVGELVDEDTDEVVDAVLLWYRDGDGDLFELLTDALGPLADNGVVWLLTPKAGRDGHVEPSEISESAPTAGLQQTSTLNAGKDWTAARLVSPRGRKKKLTADDDVPKRAILRDSLPDVHTQSAVTAMISPYQAHVSVTRPTAFVVDYAVYDSGDSSPTLDVELSSAVYLDTDDEAKIAAVIQALDRLLDLTGYGEGRDVRIQRGSIFRRAA